MAEDTKTESEDSNEFQEHVPVTGELDATLQKPLEETMEHQSSFTTGLREQLATGNYGDYDVTVSQAMDGGIWVEFMEGGPTVKVSFEELVTFAAETCEDNGYLYEDED